MPGQIKGGHFYLTYNCIFKGIYIFPFLQNVASQSGTQDKGLINQYNEISVQPFSQCSSHLKYSQVLLFRNSILLYVLYFFIKSSIFAPFLIFNANYFAGNNICFMLLLKILHISCQNCIQKFSTFSKYLFFKIKMILDNSPCLPKTLQWAFLFANQQATKVVPNAAGARLAQHYSN